MEAQTLVLVGREDPFCSVRAAERALIDIVGSKLIDLEDCGHFAGIEKREDFMDVVGNFLSSETRLCWGRKQYVKLTEKATLGVDSVVESQIRSTLAKRQCKERHPLFLIIKDWRTSTIQDAPLFLACSNSHSARDVHGCGLKVCHCVHVRAIGRIR